MQAHRPEASDVNDVENEGGGDDEQQEDEREDDDDDDLFDVHGHEEIDPDEFESDEAYAGALQDAEERKLAVRLMAFTGIHERESNGSDENGTNSQYGDHHEARMELGKLENATKRRGWLVKKARELAIRYDDQIGLIIFSSSGQMFKYCSPNYSLKICLTPI
ncbi:MADS-box transcription factor 29 [Nymphaea thermarum]|nr:MADS-box transcription factor 29 [Nymphaea thermarum]